MEYLVAQYEVKNMRLGFTKLFVARKISSAYEAVSSYYVKVKQRQEEQNIFAETYAQAINS